MTIIKSSYFSIIEFHSLQKIGEIFWSSSIFQTNLTLIKDRLETNYYRSKANLQWEIELLHSNCIKFNGETDEESNGLFSLSKALTDGLYEIIAMDS